MPYRVSFTCQSSTKQNTIKLLQWRHNGRDSVSNHQPHACLLNRLFRRRSKKTSKLRVTGLLRGKCFHLMTSSCTTWSHSRSCANIDGLMEDWSNSIANALELLQSYTKPSIYALKSTILTEPQSDKRNSPGQDELKPLRCGARVNSV